MDDYINIDNLEVNKSMSLYQVQPKENSNMIVIKMIGNFEYKISTSIIESDDLTLSSVLHTDDELEAEYLSLFNLFTYKNGKINSYYSYIFIPDAKYVNVKDNSYMTGSFSFVKLVDDTLKSIEDSDIYKSSEEIFEKLIEFALLDI